MDARIYIDDNFRINYLMSIGSLVYVSPEKVKIIKDLKELGIEVYQ